MLSLGIRAGHNINGALIVTYEERDAVMMVLLDGIPECMAKNSHVILWMSVLFKYLHTI